MSTPQKSHHTPRERDGSRTHTPRNRDDPYDINKLGEGAYGAPSSQGRGGGGGAGGNAGGAGKSKESRFRRIIKQLREANVTLETDYTQLRNEISHYQGRLTRIEDTHKLEIQRLKKEVDYHKRLRQGAEARALDLEDTLRHAQRQTAGFDEAQSSLIEQSTLLVSKNAELQHKLKSVEAQVVQLGELKACLEAELADVYADRDRLVTEMEQMWSRKHSAHTAGLEGLQELDEEELEGSEEGGEEGGEGEGGSGAAAQ